MDSLINYTVPNNTYNTGTIFPFHSSLLNQMEWPQNILFNNTFDKKTPRHLCDFLEVALDRMQSSNKLNPLNELNPLRIQHYKREAADKCSFNINSEDGSIVSKTTINEDNTVQVKTHNKEMNASTDITTDLISNLKANWISASAGKGSLNAQWTDDTINLDFDINGDSYTVNCKAGDTNASCEFRSGSFLTNLLKPSFGVSYTKELNPDGVEILTLQFAKTSFLPFFPKEELGSLQIKIKPNKEVEFNGDLKFSNLRHSANILCKRTMDDNQVDCKVNLASELFPDEYEGELKLSQLPQYLSAQIKEKGATEPLAKTELTLNEEGVLQQKFKFRGQPEEISTIPTPQDEHKNFDNTK